MSNTVPWTPNALADLRECLDLMTADGTVPGGVIAHGTFDSEPGYLASGVVAPECGDARPGPGTVYDVASLTKVLATWPLVGTSLMDGFTLDTPIRELLTGIPTEAPGGQMTVRQVLAHTSGLRADTRLDQYRNRPEPLAELICGEDLIAEPGAGHRYINRGFILLGLALAHYRCRRLDELAAELWQHLGMASTTYGPVPRSAQVAPTEQRLTGGPRLWGMPHDDNAALLGATFTRSTKASEDTDFHAVIHELERQDPVGLRMAAILVEAMHRVIDGPRTGRFHLGQISALERSSLHAITANLIQNEFDFPDGHPTDFLVAGVQVRYCFSTIQGWGIPASAMNQICLLVEVGEEGRHWNMGIVRATPEHLGPSGNRDGKRHPSATGVSAVRWLHREAKLPISVMADLPAATLENITSHKNAQVRIERLFRSVQGSPIDRQTIVALARSVIHGERRARESRDRLTSQGILLLTHHDDQLISDLQLPALGPSQWLSIRVVRMQRHHGSTPSTLLAGEPWCVARLQDPVEELPIRRY
ncbi:NaeI family type II restriction endonuclease [Kitasatospora sp. NPDC085464]|uniref:NaeI family type II restriction endonuclease n=1 Tax=Kitasatospora sp. NPDC085464 TaxID=3364063 RepID=UPI0037C79272